MGSDVPFFSEQTPVPVPMELRRIISSTSETQDQHFLILKETEGERSFPIMIGLYEVSSIERRIRNMPSQRPLTHDLVVNVIEQLGGELSDILINELREGTYFAKLRIRMNGELVEVDARPSDAIALAVSTKVPIYVSEDVIEEATEDQGPF